MPNSIPDPWGFSNKKYQSSNMDIELLKKEIGSYFPFYENKFEKNVAVFFCRIDNETLEQNFDDLRISLSKKGYIPMLRYQKGEHLIYVIKKPKLKTRPVWINALLFILTMFTTTLAGSIQWASIKNTGDFILTDIFKTNFLIDGFLYFSVPLMLILGIHEMGHYYASKKHNLDSSLPFFIPLPPPFILGTFGALISTREPIPDRKTLLDVGIAGPLCGFLVAIPIALFGFYFMQISPIYYQGTGESITIVYPLILEGLNSFFSIPNNTIMHPTFFAGWVGLFLTSVQLLPVGQLDGGHVARALLKEKSKYLGYIVIVIVLILGLFYTGWLFLAFIILFLIGTSHQPPLNEYSKLNNTRKILAIIGFIIFLICFAPIPMQ